MNIVQNIFLCVQLPSVTQWTCFCCAGQLLLMQLLKNKQTNKQPIKSPIANQKPSWAKDPSSPIHFLKILGGCQWASWHSGAPCWVSLPQKYPTFLLGFPWKWSRGSQDMVGPPTSLPLNLATLAVNLWKLQDSCQGGTEVNVALLTENNCECGLHELMSEYSWHRLLRTGHCLCLLSIVTHLP